MTHLSTNISTIKINTHEQLLALISNYLKKPLDSPNEIYNCMVVDLPAGFGKTYTLNKLFSDKLIGLRSVVACPTAMATYLYKGVENSHISKISTLHSLFKQIPNLNSLNDSWSNFSNLKIEQSCIFVDEFSMISERNFLAIIMYCCAHKKHLVMLGDSCQMVPINGKLIDFSTAVITNCSISLVQYVYSTNNQLLPRFDKLTFKLVINLRRCIQEDNPNKKYVFSPKAFELWSRFVKKMTIFKTIQDKYIIDALVHKSVCIPVGYLNRLSLTIQNKYYARLNIDTSKCTRVPVLCSNSKDVVENLNFEKHFKSLYYEQMTICVGSIIICKKNSQPNFYNGQLAVVDSIENGTIGQNKMFISDAKQLPIVNCTLLHEPFSKIVLEYECETVCNTCVNSIPTNSNTTKTVIWKLWWRTYYATTLYNLQGSTINSIEKLVARGDDCFKASSLSHLRTIYMICSRVKKLDQLVVDLSFCHFFFKAIFKKSNTHKVYLEFQKFEKELNLTK